MLAKAPILGTALALVMAGCGGDEDCSLTDSCPGRGPATTISAPADGGSAAAGENVTFTGSATDVEDGPITGAALRWTSDLDGQIGTGGSFTTNNLSGGNHEIALTATDNDGNAGSDTILFSITGPPSVTISAPVNQASGAPRTITEGASVTFTGSATDAEDGTLSGGSLVWTSNVDGQIGTGTSFSTSALSAGMHTVTLTATDSDTNESKATVLVIVKPPAAAGYQIHIRYSEGVELTAPQQAAIEEAVARLQTIITGDVPNVPVTDLENGGSCGGATIPKLTESVDDIIIYLEFVPIDGPQGVLGSAGPCFTRVDQSSGETTALSLLGGMRFDSDDLELMETTGLLNAIMLHEMMHVLGFGIFWDDAGSEPNREEVPFEFLEQPSDSTHAEYTPGMTDTHFIGTNAMARFDSIGGATYMGGVVPVENDTAKFKKGSLDGHWRESVFDNEIMSTSANLGQNPLSEVTVAQFEDLGYTVDFDAADPYVLTLLVVFGERAEPARIDLSGDVWRGPLYAVDHAGSVRRIR